MIQVHAALTATNTNVLSGTILENAGPGLWLVQIAADTDAVTVTITTSKTRAAQADVVAMTDSDATLDNRKIRTYEITVPQGELQPTVQVGGTVTECNVRITRPASIV